MRKATLMAVAVATLLQAAPAVHAEGVLNIFNWGDYTSPELIEKFEKAYDVDVTITDYAEGEGKHRGRLGFVTTANGAVGAGFTDQERELLWAEAQAGILVGQVIEVSCLELTPDRKFRHPFFVRMRPDKSVT